MTALRAGRTRCMELCSQMELSYSAITGLSDHALVKIGTGETSERDARVLLRSREKKIAIPVANKLPDADD